MRCVIIFDLLASRLPFFALVTFVRIAMFAAFAMLHLGLNQKELSKQLTNKWH